jgi:pyrimidine deaminase RibD-like protein
LRDGVLDGFHGEPKQHAEEALLAQLADVDLASATAYVTLEPCTERRKGTPCANHLASSGIKTVFVANSDPHPKISNASWRIFFEQRIAVRDFSYDLRNEARRDNIKFFDKFVYSPQPQSSASFNFGRNGGERILGPTAKQFCTRWTPRGHGTIWALDYDFNVCVAKHCNEFAQVDDPSRWFEDSHYSKPVEVGQIVIFRNAFGFALVKVREVVHPDCDIDRNGILKFDYQLRFLAETAVSEAPSV